MRELPKSIIERRELNLRQGIKSSLSSIRSIVALVYTLYRSNNRKAIVDYSESVNGGLIKLNSSLENNVKTFLGIDDLGLISNNPLFKSQMEALQVGIELIFKLGKVEFIDENLASSAERTGGNRYEKRICFGTNIQIIDTFLSSYDADLTEFLNKWLQNQESSKSEIDEGVKKLLTIFSEETQFKLRYNNSEISFQQEGIYQEFAKGNTVVGKDEHENVGPFRVFKSYVKEGLHPYIDDAGDDFVAKNRTADASEYYQMVSNALDLIPRRTQITSFVPADVEGEDGFSVEESIDSEIKQLIYYGCPGSGKSHMVNRLVNSSFFKYLLSRQLSESSCNKYANVLKTQWIVDIAKRSAVDIESLYDTEDIKLINKVLENPEFIEKDEKGQRMYSTALKHYVDYLNKKKNIFRTTFHPDTDYASFVGCYKPISVSMGSGIVSYDDLKEKAASLDIEHSKDRIKLIVDFISEYSNSFREISIARNTSINQLFKEIVYPNHDSFYARFIEKLIEKKVNNTNEICYRFSPQVFTNAYVKAWQNPGEKIYLIIEEINRGNCAQIFGDLFQLLDRKSGVSEYPVKADKDLADYLRRTLGEDHEGIKNGELKLPSNLIIWATMNTSDQSLFPMDSAFKRRWDWEYVPINYDKNIDSGKFIIKLDDDTKYLWVNFLDKVNKEILDKTASEDKQMGNYFIKGDVNALQFTNKVMFYLWNEVCKEEYGTQRNFFRKGKDVNGNSAKEFSFTDLFKSDNGKTVEQTRIDILKKFMEYLDVIPVPKE